MKTCRECGKTPDETSFRPSRHTCRLCTNLLSKKTYLEKPEAKARSDKNNISYYQKNKERIIADKLAKRDKTKYNSYMKERRDKNPTVKISNAMSAGINYQLRKNNRSWTSILGYTLDDLMQHLEKQFVEGMSWDNYGLYKKNGPRTWHMDHIIPVTAFTFTSYEDEQFKQCYALPNLRPLWADLNIAKGNKYVP